MGRMVSMGQGVRLGGFYEPPYAVGQILTFNGTTPKYQKILSVGTGKLILWIDTKVDRVILPAYTKIRPVDASGNPSTKWIYTMQLDGYLTYELDPNWDLEQPPSSSNAPEPDVEPEWVPDVPPIDQERPGDQQPTAEQEQAAGGEPFPMWLLLVGGLGLLFLMRR